MSDAQKIPVVTHLPRRICEIQWEDFTYWVIEHEYLEFHIMVEWEAAAAHILLRTKELVNDVCLRNIFKFNSLIWQVKDI